MTSSGRDQLFEYDDDDDDDDDRKISKLLHIYIFK